MNIRLIRTTINYYTFFYLLITVKNLFSSNKAGDSWGRKQAAVIRPQQMNNIRL